MHQLKPMKVFSLGNMITFCAVMALFDNSDYRSSGAAQLTEIVGLKMLLIAATKSLLN